jgi:hypothetical protein
MNFYAIKNTKTNEFLHESKTSINWCVEPTIYFNLDRLKKVVSRCLSRNICLDMFEFGEIIRYESEEKDSQSVIRHTLDKGRVKIFYNEFKKKDDMELLTILKNGKCETGRSRHYITTGNSKNGSVMRAVVKQILKERKT